MTSKVQTLVQAMLDRSVVLGIGLMIALLAVGAVGNYRNIQSVQRNTSLVMRTHDVDVKAAEMLRMLTEAVVKQRGYLISRNEAARKDSLAFLDLSKERLDELQQATISNSEQQVRLRDLRKSLEDFRTEIIARMNSRASGSSLEELSPGTTEITAKLDELRSQILTFRAEESRRLQEREDDVGSALRTALISSVILFAMGLALFMGIIELIRRNATIQQRQQERIAVEREQLLVTLASIDDAVISVDKLGRITQWSDPAERLTGRQRETVVDRPVNEMLHLVDELTAQTVSLPVSQVLQGSRGGKIDSPCMVQAVDGRATPVSVRLSPIEDEARHVSGAVIVLRELNEERQAETARTERARVLSLRADIGMIISRAGRTDEQLQQCVNSIGEQLAAAAACLWTIDAETAETHAVAIYNRAGWTSSPELLAQAGPALVQEVMANNEILRRPVTPEELALEWTDAATDRPDLYLWACPLRIENRALGVLLLCTRKPLSDLASSELSLVGAKLSQFIERRSIEEARQESEELFRTLANSIPQLAWMMRPDGFVFWYSQRWYDYTGTTLEEMQGWGWQSVHDPAELPHVLESLKHSLATGEPWDDTFPLRSKEGEFRWHLSRMLPVRDDQGRIRLWFGTNTDITQQRDAERRLRRVIDSMFAFVGILAEDGTLIEINQAPLIASGLVREDVIGRKFWDCSWWTHDDAVRQRVHDAFDRSVRGELIRYDEQIQLTGAQPYTIDFMLQPVFDHGKLMFVIPSGVDVTARKRAEEQVAASEEFLRSVLDALASHIAVLDESGVILMVNRAWREFAQFNGLDSSNYGVGQNYLQVCAPSTADCPTEAQMAADGIRSVLDGMQPWFSMEYPCHSPTEKRWFQMRVDRLTNSEAIRVVVSHENITSRVQSEEATRRWSAQQQRLAEIALEISGLKERAEIMQVVCSGARTLIGSIGAETLLTRGDGANDRDHAVNFHEGVMPEGRDAVLHDAERIRQTVLTTNRTLRVARSLARADQSAVSRDGELVVGTGSLAVPIINQQGKNIGLIHLREKNEGDFTSDDEAILMQLAQMVSEALERARLYEELKSTDEKKDQFLATLAHELRNPLSAISAATQLLLLRPDDAEEVKSTAQIAARQCSHLKQLVDDLLDISRISRGKLNLQLAPVRLQDVIAHAIETTRSVIDASLHELTSQVTPVPLMVQGDSVRLTQVVSNLLVNAAKYTPSQGKISVELRQEGNTGVIAVKDNGIGIVPEMIDRIFELFAQVESAYARSQGGLGIGLTLSKTLVVLHGGTIEVQSEGENRGSTFSVRLPLISVSAEVAAGTSNYDNEIRTEVRHRILIVDDNRAAVHLLGRLLSTLGHEVHTASDGQTALAMVSQYCPEMVISDIGMPDMNGYELAEKIRAMGGRTHPVLVALTGYGQEADRQAAYNAGFSHHLTKPVNLLDLEQLMDSLTANP